MLWVCADDLERGIDRFVEEHNAPPDIFSSEQVSEAGFPKETCPFCQGETRYLIVPMGVIKS